MIFSVEQQTTGQWRFLSYISVVFSTISYAAFFISCLHFGNNSSTGLLNHETWFIVNRISLALTIYISLYSPSIIDDKTNTVDQIENYFNEIEEEIVKRIDEEIEAEHELLKNDLDGKKIEESTKAFKDLENKKKRLIFRKKQIPSYIYKYLSLIWVELIVFIISIIFDWNTVIALCFFLMGARPILILVLKNSLPTDLSK